LSGKYIYGDYIRGSVWALTYDDKSGQVLRNEQVIESGIPVLAFGEDQKGEIYYSIISQRGEGLYRFAAN
jgi:hypothetical protein